MNGFMVLALATVSSFAFSAQTQQTMQGWGLESNYNQLYNPANEVTMRGRVAKVVTSAPEPGMSSAAEIVLRERNGQTLYVDLGPAWYINHQRRRLAVGQEVSVTGAMIQIGQKERLMARKVTAGGHVLYLRELTGYPLWVATRSHERTLDVSSNSSTVASNEANSSTGPVAIATAAPAPQPTAEKAADQTTVKGTIQRTISVQDPKTGQVENYLVVTTPTGTINVDIGPAWYQQQQPVTWTPGGNVIMTGITPSSPVVTLPNFGNPIILPTGIQYGGQYMVLRNGAVNVWNAWY